MQTVCITKEISLFLIFLSPSQIFMIMNIQIPEGLGSILCDFTVAALEAAPSNLLEFAADYFRRASEAAKTTKNDGKAKDYQEMNGFGPAPNKSKVPMYIIVDDDEEAKEPDPETLKPKNSKNKYARRGSVSAERYDPEADDVTDDSKVVHSKTDSQRERLAEAVKGILLFKSLDSNQLSDVVDAMFEKRVTPNEAIIKQGDDGDNFYVVDRGRFGVLVGAGTDMKRVHQFDNSGSFGELALLYNMPRSATVVAETEGILWAMDRQSFRRIVLRAAFKKRKMFEQLLKEVPLLNSLDEYERMNLADALQTKEFAPGQNVITQGDEADGMYFVEDGTLSVIINKQGNPVEVARLQKGKYFGEVALIEDKPRTATVQAIEKAKVAFLERESFERLLGPCLDIMKRNSTEYKKQNRN
ncbi:cAMP-dependent protein kinase type II regulatory subunit [Aplysia californica]|uniref:cAMP-dependent protein kinase type II regulatory subunit n=1 Tax=Aplysia californica TaxID=6500 RepID=A0ABM0K4R0_APLCA|nr:cAMP-dependent protein kinase type II regulatory subunit [Aplysia californica]